MLNEEFYENAYNDYFGINKNNIVTKNVDNSPKPIGNINNERLCANGNIQTIDEFGNELRKLLNAVWGSDWGELAPESSFGTDSDDVTIPSIRYSVNLREISEGKSPKPTLMDVQMEDIDGTPTGEPYKVYRQFFDCIIEFNIRTSSSFECSKLSDMFEELLILHSGYLKRKGVSEIFFLKEVPPRYSFYFVEKIPAKCLYYFVRLEKVKTIKESVLKEVDAKISLIEENFDKQSIELTIQ